MSKQVYISADYDQTNGDQAVVNELLRWGQDNLHKVNFIDMSNPSSGSVAKSDDCRICDLKREFNRQINASSAVIFVIGDMTASRLAGNSCERMQKEQRECSCTPYKQNRNRCKSCKVAHVSTPGKDDDVGNINRYSYLQHEFEQAKKKKKKIIIIYNSTRKESGWLPAYMSSYKDYAQPFWKLNDSDEKIGDYSYIKDVLEF